MLLEIPANAATVKAAGKYCYEVMTSAPKMWFNIEVPFKADYEIGKNWSELVEFDLSDEAETNNTQIVIEDGDDAGKHISWDAWYGGSPNANS